jgi:predicted ABC-type transport system involved in lysophospholipase L1 biosynthesis ATPase subunit
VIVINQPQLTAKGVHRSFKIGSRKIEVLRGISMEVHRGEALFLCGVSGAGKTTLLYTLAGLERPEAGEVVFDGHKLYRNGSSADARIRNEKMGFVFQSYFLLPEFTALENVLVPSLIRNKQDLSAAVDKLERVGLADRMNHLPNELSGGEQQRVAIARALINGWRRLVTDALTSETDYSPINVRLRSL